MRMIYLRGRDMMLRYMLLILRDRRCPCCYLMPTARCYSALLTRRCQFHIHLPVELLSAFPMRAMSTCLRPQHRSTRADLPAYLYLLPPAMPRRDHPLPEPVRLPIPCHAAQHARPYEYRVPVPPAPDAYPALYLLPCSSLLLPWALPIPYERRRYTRDQDRVMPLPACQHAQHSTMLPR